MKLRYIPMILLCVNVFGEEVLQTNLELMGRLIIKMIEQDTTIPALVPEPFILLKDPVDREALVQFVSSYISEGLIQNGYIVFMEGDSGRSGMILSWHFEKVRIQYKNPERSSLFGSIHYERKAEIGLRIQLIDSYTQEVRWSDTLESSTMDTVSIKDLKFIEQDGLILGHPARQKSGGIRRWFEPVVMIGLTSVFVYLFYSIRS